MNVLALIPARLGSKRVPQKNIKSLGEKPLIAYTIEAALKSQAITRVVVSTDSQDIADVAKNFGADVPFLRPTDIAQEGSTEMEFFTHALNWLKEHEEYVPDLIVLLYPTAPFRRVETIDKAVNLIMDHPEADSLRSVKLCGQHPCKMWTISDDKWLEPLMPHEDKNVHTFSYQVLPKVYIQNANIYIYRPKTILEQGNPIGEKVLSFVMDDMESMDINYSEDFHYAERLLEEGQIDYL